MALRKTVPATLTFRLDAKLRKQLGKIAVERHMSEGALVALFVEEGLERDRGVELRLRNVEYDVAQLRMWLESVRAVVGLSGQTPPKHVAAANPHDGDEPEPELAGDPERRTPGADA